MEIQNNKNKLGLGLNKDKFKSKNEVQISLDGQEVKEFEPDLNYPALDQNGRVKQDLLCSNSYRITSGLLDFEGKNRGFYQQQTQELLKNSDLTNAFSIVQQYIQSNQRKFYLFEDTETGLFHIAKQLNRFDIGYIERIKAQLGGIKQLGTTSIMHIVLTLPHTDFSDYITQYQTLKAGVTAFIEKFKDMTHQKQILYFMTFEVKRGSDGLFHQHLHLLIFRQGFLPKKVLLALKRFWHNKTGSKYIFFKYISKDRNYRAFEYAVKYVVKEVGNINLTTVLLFSVKGKSYTMSIPLQKLLGRNNEIQVNKQRFKFICSFQALEVFLLKKPSEFDKSNLSWFFSQLTEGEVKQLQAGNP